MGRRGEGGGLADTIAGRIANVPHRGAGDREAAAARGNADAGIIVDEALRGDARQQAGAFLAQAGLGGKPRRHAAQIGERGFERAQGKVVAEEEQRIGFDAVGKDHQRRVPYRRNDIAGGIDQRVPGQRGVAGNHRGDSRRVGDQFGRDGSIATRHGKRFADADGAVKPRGGDSRLALPRGGDTTAEMIALLLALLLVQLAGIGGRDQLLLAGLVARNGQRLSLLAVAAGTGALACLLAGWLARESEFEFDHRLRLLVAAMALAVGGIESLAIGPPKQAAEPTHSLGAAAVVLLAHQLTDSARMLAFAIVLATQSWLAVVGAAFGGAVALAIGWFGGETLLASATGGGFGSLRTARRLCGVAMLGGAAWALYLAVGNTDRFWRLLSPY